MSCQLDTGRNHVVDFNGMVAELRSRERTSPLYIDAFRNKYVFL